MWVIALLGNLTKIKEPIRYDTIDHVKADWRPEGKGWRRRTHRDREKKWRRGERQGDTVKEDEVRSLSLATCAWRGDRRRGGKGQTHREREGRGDAESGG